MKKETDFKENGKYTANGVIERGYAIYDEWKSNKYSSRKIVKYVSKAVSLLNSKKTFEAQINALAHLFALDTRIKIRYKSILRCIFLFFSWRRETKALKLLKALFNLENIYDVHTLIEIVLEDIKKAIEIEEENERNGQAKGGKTRTKETGAGEATKTAQDGIEAKTDSNKTLDSKENKEEETEEIGETLEDLPIKEEIQEKSSEETVNTAQNDVSSPRIDIDALLGKEKFTQTTENKEENYTKEENNGKDNQKSEPINKSNENQGYNNAVDSPPLFDEGKKAEPENKNSFIDEVIMDNLAMGKRDFIGNVNLSQEKGEVENLNIKEPIKIDESALDNVSGSEAHLYDKMVLDMRTQNDQGVREQIRVEESISSENELRRAVNDTIPIDVIMAYKEAGVADTGRRLDAYCKEHDIVAINDPNGAQGEHNNASAPKIVNK